MNLYKNRYNIVITVFDLHFGGISNLILQTAPSLKKNVNLQVVYFGPKDEMLIPFSNAGIDVKRIKYNGLRDFLSSSKQLSILIREGNVHIVSTNLFLDKVIVALSRIRVNFKIMSTLHSAKNPYEGANLKFFLRYKIEDFFHRHIANRNIAVSKASLKSWIKYRNLPTKNTKVLYSGINELECRKNVSIDFNIKPKIFVTACRFTPEKGLTRLINYFNDLNRISNHWEFWIIGDGFLMKELTQLVKDMNLNNQIKFLGFQTNLCAYYKDADYYINSSFHEAFPVSILEAQSVGLPVIGSNVGGIPEIITSGYNGFLINFEKNNEVINILNQCINLDSNQYSVYSKNSLKNFTGRFSIDNYTKNFIKEIEELKIAF